MDETKATDIDKEIVLAMLNLDAFGSGQLAVEKLSALTALHAIARAYRREHLPEDTIICPIILKKIEFIKSASTKAQLREILLLPKVRRNSDGKIRPVGEYTIPEEELILWSRTSLQAGGPLIPAAANRYMELFRQVFPDLAEVFGI